MLLWKEARPLLERAVHALVRDRVISRELADELKHVIDAVNDDVDAAESG